MQCMCFGLDNHYSDVAVRWTVSLANMMWAGRSVQGLCCGFDSQYSNQVVGCSVSTATVLCVGQTVQQL